MSQTKGLKEEQPRNLSQREKMAKKCPYCLLNLQLLKFPVCTENCQYNCRGIVSALVRARQYHHEDIAKKAEELEMKYCKVKKHKKII